MRPVTLHRLESACFRKNAPNEPYKAQKWVTGTSYFWLKYILWKESQNGRKGEARKRPRRFPDSPYHFTVKRDWLHSPLCCLSLQGWLSSAWLTARGGVVQSAVYPRPMGESARLLAEASVGKNAERVSHEPGARELSINTAGVWQRETRLALRVLIWQLNF